MRLAKASPSPAFRLSPGNIKYLKNIIEKQGSIEEK